MRHKALLSLVLGSLVLLGIGLASTSLAGAGPSLSATPTAAVLPTPVLGALDLAAVSRLDLRAYPVLPVISAHARQIYRQALAQGSNPRAFIKVGDCMTANPYFLVPLGAQDYALGPFADLQPVIDYFLANDPEPFSRSSQAAAGGFNAASVLDSLWANPAFCQPGETPLACEVRLMRPAIALIMFGTNDVFYLNEAQFDYFLRAIVVETIRQAALPVLSTFPHRPEFPEKSVLYNQIVVQVALDYDIPLINLWAALEDLPNAGVDPDDPTHLSVPASGAVCHFVDDNLQAGFTMRNLVTLQTLEALLAAQAD